MKGLLQRVRGARVEVAGEVVGSIDQGLLVLVAVVALVVMLLFATRVRQPRALAQPFVRGLT